MLMHSFAFLQRWNACVAHSVSVSVLFVLALQNYARPVFADEPSADAKELASTSMGALDDSIQNFLATYCLACHDEGSSEGDREFETFATPISSQRDLITLDEIIDQVTLRTMPPEDADQPSDALRVEVLEQLRAVRKQSQDAIQGTTNRTALRRLSHREYENTLATLFDRRVDTLGLTASFPKENTSEHLDTIGSSLVTSGFLLDHYFQAASRLVETRLASPESKTCEWHFTDHFVQYEELQWPHQKVLNYEFLCLYEQPNTDTRQGGYGHIEDFLEGVPESGTYEIQVHACAMHRDTHYDPSIFGIDFSEPFQLALVPGDVRAGHIHYPQSIEPILATTVVPDSEPEWLTMKVWLETGQTPRFIFPNGPYESRASVIEINNRYKDELADEGEDFKGDVDRSRLLERGKLPHIRIGEIKIRGPLQEPNGRREEVAVFGPGGFAQETASDQLFRFAKRAFRRPLEDADRERIRATYEKIVASGQSHRQAALDTLKFILCSPSFLYLGEFTNESVTQLNDIDLASRLSYAIWAAPPDATLTSVAEEGKLVDPNVLRSQINRLLDDPRSTSFVEGFLDGYLNLRELGNAPPPRDRHRHYYAENLVESMKSEAHRLLSHLLSENLPVTDLLDCDYGFVDKKLAKLYGLEGHAEMRLEDGFKRVSFRESDPRGGVLGMAAVLAVSANGVETSPVTRGVWVLENLLGTPPSPPPDEVPSIDSDVSDARTIREKLDLHRADATCAACHRKIDPLGFPLENFDPIGQWRTHYEHAGGLPIDASGKFASGEAFNGFAEFKSALVATRKDLFLRHFTEMLLSYATGRTMTAMDRFEIDTILQRNADTNFRIRDLMEDCLTSEIFCSR